MQNAYWTGRSRAAMAMARGAASSKIRLIHYDLAGRYSILAAQSRLFPPAFAAPPAEGERAALGLPLPDGHHAEPAPGARRAS